MSKHHPANASWNRATFFLLILLPYIGPGCGSVSRVSPEGYRFGIQDHVPKGSGKGYADFFFSEGVSRDWEIEIDRGLAHPNINQASLVIGGKESPFKHLFIAAPPGTNSFRIFNTGDPLVISIFEDMVTPVELVPDTPQYRRALPGTVLFPYPLVELVSDAPSQYRVWATTFSYVNRIRFYVKQPQPAPAWLLNPPPGSF